MPGPIRFHLDENVDHAIAHGLRRHGIDVTVSSDTGLLRATDDEQLAFTRAEQCVIVTHDEDFLILHQRGVPHAGIAYCHPDALGIGDLIRGLLVIWGAMTPEEMMNHVEFL
jgi:uncharacterized protein with PIN domain